MASSRWPEVRRNHLNDEVYSILRRSILDGTLAPGERLNLQELEQQMRVSRTPLIRALDRLAMEGLVVVRPSRGTYVANPTAADVAMAFDLRQLLETYAAELLAPRITEAQLAELRAIAAELQALAAAQLSTESHERYIQQDYLFHHTIVRFADNPMLLEFWDRARAHVQVIRTLYLMGQAELDETKAIELATVQPEHDSILRALEARDAATLRQVLAHHIEWSKQWAIRVIEEHAARERR